ncbi:MAG TPA: hypothetical protein VFF27_06085 [Bacteroidia bacterium]|jgi:hypothetical protein|nr:hypothetical protein [Bacteroidia bacterium]
MKNRYTLVAFLSFLLCLLIGITSTISLYIPNFYSKETPNWQIQCIGQDYINLFVIVPFLLLSIFSFLIGKKIALFLWAGSVLYLLYTYIIYCFDVHFNIFFAIYCLILSICFYLLIYFFYLQTRSSNFTQPASGLKKTIGFYFITLSILFYGLWLSDIFPAIFNNTVPKSLTDIGLPTNAVQVIDLSVVLPGMFITGILLLKNKLLGFIVAPILLTFFVLMDITIGTLNIFMFQNGLTSSIPIAVVMAVLAIGSSLLLIFYFKKKKAI